MPYGLLTDDTLTNCLTIDKLLNEVNSRPFERYRIDFARGMELDAEPITETNQDGYLTFKGEGYTLEVKIQGKNFISGWYKSGGYDSEAEGENGGYEDFNIMNVLIRVTETDEETIVTDEYFIKDIENYLNKKGVWRE